MKSIDQAKKKRKEERNIIRDRNEEIERELKVKLRIDKQEKNKVYKVRGRKMMRSMKPQLSDSEDTEESMDEERLNFAKYVQSNA
jgi:hypothetical protein